MQFVEFLIDAGVNVNALDVDSCTPLHVACEKGYDEVVETLIIYGADVNAGDKDEYRPLHKAARSGNAPKSVFPFISLDCELNLNKLVANEVRKVMHSKKICYRL